MIGIGLLSTTLAFFIYFCVRSQLGLVMSSCHFLVPLSASGLGIAFLGEQLVTAHHRVSVDRFRLAVIDGRSKSNQVKTKVAPVEE